MHNGVVCGKKHGQCVHDDEGESLSSTQEC